MEHKKKETDAASQSPPAQAQRAAPMRLAPWFWGAIIAMACVSAGLGVYGALKSSPQAQGDGRAQSALPAGEWLPAQLQQRLSLANEQALAQTIAQIDPLLDAVYQPAYDAIALYADFHYSVFGEYAQLSAAALGDVGAQLQAKVFAGFDARLTHAGEQLNGVFTSAFSHALAQQMPPGQMLDGALGEHTRAALNQTQTRMAVTASVVTAAVVGSKAVSAAVAKAMAKKIAAKLAVKAAAKTGGKVAAASAGAGTGGLLCAWAGPGAGLCAAAGGVGAWLVTDYGLLKLDEFWNRQEFEADLRAMLDAQKAEHRQLLAQALEARAVQVQTTSRQTVQNYDFTVRELYGGGNAKVCAMAQDWQAQYDRLSHSLVARTPQAIAALRTQVQAQQESLSLGPLADEMREHLAAANQAVLRTVAISGHWPAEIVPNRALTVRLLINGQAQAAIELKDASASHFSLEWAPEMILPIDANTSVTVTLEQHFFLRANAVLEAQGQLTPLLANEGERGAAGADAFENVSLWRVQVPLAWQPQRGVPDQASPATQVLTAQLALAPLPDLVSMPNCQ